MSQPSIISGILKLQSFLTKEEKIKWLGIVGFALFTSMLEMVTASIIIVFAQVLNQPDMGQWYLSKVGYKENLSSSSIIFNMALIVGIVYLFKNSMSAFEVFFQNSSIQRMNFNFKKKLLYRYAEGNYEYYLARNSSYGMQIVASDVEQVFSPGMTSLANILSEGIVFIVLIAMLVWMNFSLFFLILGIGIIMWLIVSKGLLPQFYKWGLGLQEASLYGIQHLLQFFHAFKELILLGKKDGFINEYLHYSSLKSRIQVIQTTGNALPRIAIEVLFVGLFVTIIAFLAFEYEDSAQMMGILGGYFYLGFRSMNSLNRVIIQLNVFKSIIPSIKRVHAEYCLDVLKGDYLNIPNFEFKKSINLSNVSFKYSGSQKSILSDINLIIQKHEFIGIVGETGSGKSTLIDVILGLLKPYKGTLLIDDQYPVNSHQWHRKIGYVPQSIYLIDDTIESNIALGELIIDEIRLNEVIKSAQLQKFISQLPAGSKTIVGERGVRLSGGECQRIAIARALYHSPEILVFDEATSSLDNETEARLMETIHMISRNHTVIMIAHRLTSLKDCHRIIVMENGSIKEITEYQKLITVKI